MHGFLRPLRRALPFFWSLRSGAHVTEKGMPMKALIPAAGLGTRFLPATKAQPKEMLLVVDRPAIQYVVGRKRVPRPAHAREPD